MDARRRLAELRVDHGHTETPRERDYTGHAFDQGASERVLIRSSVDALPPDLFRRDVVDRTDEVTRPRQTCRCVLWLRDAEIGEVRPARPGVHASLEQD